MKKLISVFMLVLCLSVSAQQTIYNADYVHKLLAKYPTTKSSLCDACKYWDNGIYKSIADTQRNMPLVTYYVYTREHAEIQESKKISRTGVFADWHPVIGQPELSGIYKKENGSIKSAINKLVWGHCQAWILLAYCEDGAILSNAETFNEGMEVQGQNIGTEIATESYCRRLIMETTDTIQRWAGTFGEQYRCTKGKISVVMPTHYWVIIKYRNRTTGEMTVEAWWMPNLVTETEDKLPQRRCTVEQISKNIGFNPLTTLF